MSQLTTVDSLTGDDVHNLKKKEKGLFVRDRILKSVSANMTNNPTKGILGYQFSNSFCISSSDRFIPRGSAEMRVGENVSFKRLTE